MMKVDMVGNMIDVEKSTQEWDESTLVFSYQEERKYKCTTDIERNSRGYHSRYEDDKWIEKKKLKLQ